MRKSIASTLSSLWLPLLLTVTSLAARDKPETWIEVQSQHFTVVTNSNEKTGRRIADQFERMRSVFHATFPSFSIDSGSPIIALTVKDEKDFRALEPASYLAKGQIRLGGLFLRAPDKNYILMRTDAEGFHPYAVIYHEYTHLLLSKSAEWLPLWLNEGLAEFFQNTDIHEKDVALGQSNFENLELLRQNHLLPLATLFAVDTHSPYYHEENKGSIFYAESWALTHYLWVRDNKEKTHFLSDYADLLEQKVDAVTAATRAFGDLEQLQSSLENYVRQKSFTYFRAPISSEIDDTKFKVQTLTGIQADAVRADILAYNDRIADARVLVDRVLQEDPKNVQACETKGFLEFRAGHLDEARKLYEQAVKLDSQSYIAHYYFAAISMQAGALDDNAQIESSLRTAIKLNPSFAPPYERLAAYEGMRRRNLDEAHLMILTALKLDPGNVNYRLTAASVLMQMDRAKDAVAVMRAALHLAKSPQETTMVQNYLAQIESYLTARDQQTAQIQTEATVTATASANPTVSESIAVPIPPEEETPKGPHHSLVGTLQNIRCHASTIDLTLDGKGKSTNLHSDNYYKIGFTALGFTPSGDLNPCKDLEGKPAKVEYVDSSAKPAVAYIVNVELHK